MVTVDEDVPSAATGPVPVMLEFAITADCGVNVTVPDATLTGDTIDRIFVSALVDVRVQVDEPVAELEEQAP